jgi:MinD-like ATPase involved in chromosome partitioning or flagellar assembly
VAAVGEPEVALVFTPDAWVEELHRHLTDHGGARVRQIVVEPEIALEEQYDVLVTSHRWPALTHAFVADLHARGRAVLGVCDREEPSARAHLVAVGADEVIESDLGPRAFVAVMQTLRVRRRDVALPEAIHIAPVRRGRVVAIGGPPGVGRTEVAVQLAVTVGGVLVDADDVAPAIAARLGLPIEPNLRTAIDAVEHARGELLDSLTTDRSGALPVLAGLPNPGAWVYVRPGEVARLVQRLADDTDVVVVDGIGSLEDVGGPPRGRFAVARALAVEADVVIGVCAATPVGVARFLSWAVQLRTVAPEATLVVAVNRAPAARYRRGELYDELTRSLPPVEVVFLADDRRVTEAMWDGKLVRPGAFTRSASTLAGVVRTAPRRGRATAEAAVMDVAS